MKKLPNIKISAAVIAVIIVAGIALCFAAGGPNLSFDFTGGTIINIEMGGEFEISDVEGALSGLGAKGFSVAKAGNYTTATMAVIRLNSAADETLGESVTESLSASYPDAELLAVETVDAPVGTQFVLKAALAAAIALVLTFGYISIRSGLAGGVIAAASGALSVLVTVSLTVLCGFFIEINTAYFAACLLVMCCSFGASVFLFDKIRENNRRFGRKTHTRSQVAELSALAVLRPMAATAAVLIVIFAALFVAGNKSAAAFALTLIFGVLAGAHITVCVSPSLWGAWMDGGSKKSGKSRKTNKAKKNQPRAKKA